MLLSFTVSSHKVLKVASAETPAVIVCCSPASLAITHATLLACYANSVPVKRDSLPLSQCSLFICCHGVLATHCLGKMHTSTSQAFPQILTLLWEPPKQPSTLYTHHCRLNGEHARQSSTMKSCNAPRSQAYANVILAINITDSSPLKITTILERSKELVNELRG